MSLVELALKKMQEAAGKATPPPRGGRSSVPVPMPSSSLEDTAQLKPVFPEDAQPSGESGSEPYVSTTDADTFMDTMQMEQVTPVAAETGQRDPPAADSVAASTILSNGMSQGVHEAATSAVPTRGRMRTDKVIRIDRSSLGAQGLLPPEHQARALADQYRQIKRPLIANAIGRGGAEKLPRGQLIMVASAMPGEGKTFTSVNLALSLALEKDLSVLLIDADAPKPHLDRALGVSGESGLLDALRDESLDPETLIIPTDVTSLTMLPIGMGSETTTELLASHRMEDIMRQLADNDPTRMIVIDSPPLLLTSESRVLAEAAGQIVLVVRAGFTPQQSVLDAISHLGEGKAIGLVLNQSTDVASAGYYYGYGVNEQAS